VPDSPPCPATWSTWLPSSGPMDALFLLTQLLTVKDAGHWVLSEQPEIVLAT
jgi:pimeloyl-ACP methyl ester carboxylesterase